MKQNGSHPVVKGPKDRGLRESRTSAAAAGHLAAIAAAAALTAAACWLFYNSFAGVFWFPVFAVFCLWVEGRQRTDRLRDRFLGDFREFLLLVSGSLTAGSAMENACLYAERELARMTSANSGVLDMIRRINRRVGMNVPLEQAFMEQADERPYEELQSFAQMLSFLRRLGGNYAEAVQRAADRIGERIDVEQEIQVMLSEKKLELRIMSVMPAAVLAYVRLTSPEYLTAVYGSPRGILFMSICLAVYLGAVLLGLWMIRIRL